jgi:hypothetical protein
MQGGIHSTLHTKYPKIKVVSTDDGSIVARNMYRFINILRINCAPSWLYLQDYAEMRGQQNIKNQTCFNYQLDAQLLYSIIYVLH